MIWVIAGTRSARDVIDLLLPDNYTIIATTTTDYGKRLIYEHAGLTTMVKAMDADEMIDFIKNHGIKLIIDASHPYSQEASLNAISASKASAIPYIRFERGHVEYNGATVVDSFEDAALYVKNVEGNILLTIGIKNLAPFAAITGRRIYVRILPTVQSIEECLGMGFLPDQIIAARFPFSKDFNKALFQALHIQYLVTKESGEEGSVREKLEAASELGIEAVVVKRPNIVYPEVYFEARHIIARAEAILKG